MFEYKTGLLLSVIVLLPIITSQGFADSILIEFDKPEYQTGDSMVISGHILDFKMPMIALSLYDPDGKILSANNVILDSNGTFSKIIPLDSPFYDKSGEYTVKLNYGKITQNEFFTITGNNSEPEIIISESITPEIISLITDKNQYYDNDFVMITGIVSTIDSPNVLIGVYDPFGTPTGFYFGQIDSDLKFSTNFLVKSGINFKTDGTYSIKAHYGETEKITNFDFYKESDTKTELENKSVINNNESKTAAEKNNSNIKSPEIIPDQNKKSLDNKIKKYDNLSVEDIELGKLLNQINLECDQSKLVDTISYYDGMGPALYRLCNFDQALIIFDDSLTKDPNNVEIITNKGSALGKLGYVSESVFYYDQALNIDSNFIPAINNKANALANMGKYDESILLYNDALQKNPDYNTARKNLKSVLSELPLENQVISVEHESLSKETPSEKLIENNPKSQTKKPSNFFEELFSSLGSFFGFHN
ncbi:MAG: tetratricopeptide repeat protein [Nitrosarchaeum sp.]|nr:tetratricopeptide repeat protein [Nitrosarchaeum sp.]